MSTKGTLVDQPGYAPTRKVAASSVGAAAGYFLADIAQQVWAHFPDSGELFFVVLLTFASGYLVRERDSPKSGST